MKNTSEERLYDREALRILEDGGLILYPTDTVWGIGCDATNPDAVARIYSLKQRADSKSMLVIVDSVESLAKWVETIPEKAIDSIRHSDSPLTIIYDSPRNIAPNLLASDGSLGIRITSDPYSRELCRHFGKPIVSTSANISGSPTPAVFAEISQEIKEAVDYTAPLRRDETAPRRPSGILKITNDNSITIIR